MTLHLANSVLGFKLQFLDVHLNSDQIGPSVVILRFKTIFGRGAWLQTVVPEEPLNQRMTNYIFADWWIPTFIAAIMLKVRQCTVQVLYVAAAFCRAWEFRLTGI